MHFIYAVHVSFINMSKVRVSVVLKAFSAIKRFFPCFIETPISSTGFLNNVLAITRTIGYVLSEQSVSGVIIRICHLGGEENFVYKMNRKLSN